jgi:acetolactate synthase-1/2/3 large subunit
METVARVLVSSLVEHGTDRVFCVAGESFLGVLDELGSTSGADVVTCRHEGSAAFMAMADAKLTGRAGVCLVNRAPGLLNAAIGVHAALQDATPLVVLTGGVETTEIGRRSFQEIDASRAFSGLAKEVLVLHDPRRAAEFLARAFRSAETGTPGPVVLVVPEDVLGEHIPGVAPSGRWAEGAATPGQAAVAEAADLLAGADRPLVIAGGRLASPEGRHALAEFARRHEVAVATSNKHIDVFDNRDPHYAGHLHNATGARQRALLDRADLVLAIGTRLDDVTTGGHRFPAAPSPAQPLVHVYPDPARIGLEYRPRLGLGCDPLVFLRMLSAQPASGGRDLAWIEELHAFEAGKARWDKVTADDGVVFGAVTSALDRITGGDVVVTVDAGTFTSWTYRHLRLSGEGLLLGATASPMGFGVPAAVAAALRLPGRSVVCVVGDGGFLMNGSEFATAVARNLPVVVIVADNGSYGTIRMHQERAYPGRTVATDLVNPDFAALARSYGAQGLTVTSDHDVEACLTKALGHHGPVVVHVRTSLEWISAGKRLGEVAK